MNPRASLPAILALLVPAACAAPDDGAWAGAVTDSAGVPVVVNPEQGLWRTGDAWTLEEEIAIGALDADPAYQFGQITGVDTDADGNLYVLDQQAREVRVFAPDGTWLRSMGSSGSGPGELGLALAGVFVIGGEVRVPDLQNQRVTRYTLQGDPAGEFRIPLEKGIPVRWDGPLSDGIVAQIRRIDPSDTAAAPAGDPVVVYAPDGTITDTLTVLPPGESLRFEGGAPRFRFFDPEPVWDLGADGTLVSGRNHEFRLVVRDGTGAVERVITLPRERTPVTERDRTVFLDGLRAAMAEQGTPPQAVEMVLGNASFADSYPMFASILSGPEGTVWVQRVRSGAELAGDDESTFDVQDLGSPRWDVFDAEGRYLGVLDFPARVQPIRAVEGRIYAITRDELDVQGLAVYRVVR